MQSTQQKDAVCPVCKGRRRVEVKGNLVTCQRCRGTGKAGQYSTK